MKLTIAHLFGVRPWELQELTHREFRSAVASAKHHIAEVRRASQAAR